MVKLLQSESFEITEKLLLNKLVAFIDGSVMFEPFLWGLERATFI